MTDHTFRIDETLRDYGNNTQINQDNFFNLRIAASLQDLVDLNRSKCTYLMDKEEYDSYLKDLSDEESTFIGVVERFEFNMQVKVYDVQEISIFGESKIKFLCYDKMEADV